MAEVRRWLQHGADVNYQDHKAKTALHRAAKAGFVEVMELLLSAGAEVNVPDKVGETALFDVVRSTIKDASKKQKALHILLKAGADRAHVNHRGEDTLMLVRKSRKVFVHWQPALGNSIYALM